VLDDPPRAEARGAVLALAERGISCHLLSGDRLAVVARVAREIGCATFGAELSPNDKPAHVEALRRTGICVAMVGDGVNDAPALAAADAGIAFGPAPISHAALPTLLFSATTCRRSSALLISRAAQRQRKLAAWTVRPLP